MGSQCFLFIHFVLVFGLVVWFLVLLICLCSEAICYRSSIREYLFFFIILCVLIQDRAYCDLYHSIAETDIAGFNILVQKMADSGSQNSLDIVSSNKRKSASPSPDPTNIPSSLIEFPRYELPVEREVWSDRLREQPQVQVLEPADWNDPIAFHLEELLLSNLAAVFRSAIKQIVQFGYSEDVAEKAISRDSLYMGDKDPVSIMVHDTLSSLKAKDISTEQDDAFDNFQHLVQYTMLEMISVVQEVRPSLTVGEAMWWLILCDLNVSQACEMEEDPLSGFTTISDPKEPSLPNISLSKQQGVEAVKFQSTASRETSQATASEGKLGPRRKGHNLKELSALRQRSIQLEKTYRTHSNRKGAFKAGKLTNTGGAIIGKTPIPPSEITSVHVKGASSNICADFPSTDAAGTAPAKESSGTLMSPSALPTMDTHPSASGKKSNPTSELDTSHTPELADYYAGIPYDESLGVCVPRNKQDELILKLVPRLQGLQNELQYWADWANKKVMQAAQRLRKYQAELKALRRVKEEAEQFEKEKQIFEDNTMKRLSDMESALSNTASQYEKASSAIPILEAENFKLKEELNAAKLWASESMTSHEKALEREQMALRKIQSLEGQKSSFREELEREKHKATELKPEISKMQNLRSQTEIRWEQERVAKERVLAQAASTKREREQLEAQAQAREDLLRQKADDGIQKYVEYIRKLEIKLSEWKWKSDCARIAALHRGTDGSCSSYSAEKRNPNSEDDNASGSLRRDRECVMCLSEESSVVFLPCAHQIVCEKCNELHDKEGMKDCPSCRAPIESRVHARYDRP